MKVKQALEQHPVIVFLAALVTGFIAGIGSYSGMLKMTNQDTVIKGTYILKSELVGRQLKTDSVRELEHLIEIGKNIVSCDVVNKNKYRAYVSRVSAFVACLDLPKEVSLNEHPVSIPFQMVKRTIEPTGLDSHFSTNSCNVTWDGTVKQIIGILEGLRA